MRIIISPAKKMKVDTDTFPVKETPVFLEKTRILAQLMADMDYQELKILWRCNDKLARQNYDRIRCMDLTRSLTPAIIAYEGLQYQHMSPMVFTDKALAYIGEHLRILSGFYGILSPFDGVVPYRLEMQAPLAVEGAGDLYEFWGSLLYEAVWDQDRILLNLASREYSRAIEQYLKPEDKMVTCVFGQLEGGRVKQKGTLAKMARGEMVRFLAENDISDLEGVKAFSALGYRFSKELSDEKKMVFVI